MTAKLQDHTEGFRFRRAHQRTGSTAFSELRNADLYPSGMIAKRTGFQATESKDFDNAALPGQLQGVAYNAASPLRFQNDDLYTYSDARDRWHRVAPWKSTISRELARLSRTLSILSGDFAELDGFRVFTWIEVTDLDPSDQFDVYRAVETLDGTMVVQPVVVATQAAPIAHARAINCGRWIALVYWPGVSAYVSRWQPDKPLEFSPSATFTTDVGFDLLGVPDRNQLWIARTTKAPASVDLTEVRADLTIDRDRAIPAPVVEGLLAIDRNPATQDILVGFRDPVGRAVWFDDDLVAYNTFSTMTLAAALTVAISGTRSGYLAIERPDTAPNNFGIDARILDRDAGTETSPVSVHSGYSLGLAGRAFVEDGEVYLLCIFVNDLSDGLPTPTVGGTQSNSAYFVLRGRDLTVVSRAWNVGQAVQWERGLFPEQTQLQAVIPRSTGWAWPVLARTAFRVRTPGAGAGSIFGFEDTGAIVQAEIALDTTNARHKLVDYGGIAVWAVGGYMRGFDGRTGFEVDFHKPPKIVAITEVTTGGSISPGNYVYAVNYYWQDKQGRRYRSLLAFFDFTVTEVGDEAKITLEVESYRITERPDVTIEVWRTVEGGTDEWFLVSQPGAYTLNDLIDPTVFPTDVLSDTDLIQQELLEQAPAGGRLAFDAVGATGFANVASDRVWFRNPQVPDQAYASQLPADSNEGMALSSVLFVELDPGEEIRAVGIQDGTYFGASQVDVSVWNGPGLQNNQTGRAWTSTRRIPTLEGCSLNGAIIDTGIGLLYATDDGPAPLSRSQSAGSAVDAITELFRFEKQAIADLVYWEDGDEIWSLDDADINLFPKRGTLTYSTNTARWTQQTRLQSVGAAVSIGGKFMLARTDGVVLVADTSIYVTGGEHTPLIIRPGWQRPSANMMAPGNLTAFGLTLLKFGTHRLKLELYADDDQDRIVATTTIDPDRDRDVIEWGDVVPVPTWGTAHQKWGYGGPSRPYKVKIGLTSGLQCNSFTIRIQDDPGSEGAGWGYVQLVANWEPRKNTDNIDERVRPNLYTLPVR